MVSALDIITLLATFSIIAVASFQIGKLFPRVKLPLITGFIFIGIIAGPYVLKMISSEMVSKGGFINDFSLAFIAFAAGAELFLSEIRRQFKSIIWMTINQLLATFVICGLVVYFIVPYVPILNEINEINRIALAILAGTIFSAKSPSSTIAVINEMRAKGSFTQMAMGVSIIKDVLIIVFFTISFGIAITLTTGKEFDLILLLVLAFELALDGLIGWLFGKLLNWILKLKMNSGSRLIIVLGLGYFVYVFSHAIRGFTHDFLPWEIHLEPLLMCIIASFYVTNYSYHKAEFHKILDKSGPVIYAIFFTYIGASLSLDILAKVWQWALFLFVVRLIALMVGSVSTAKAVGMGKRSIWVSWMPFLTQAGVGLGLAALIANEFPGWGNQFATIVIAVIVLTQLIGPPLFKFAISYVGESHTKGKSEPDEHFAIIFGLEGQSLALAKQLIANKWRVKIATLFEDAVIEEIKWVEIVHIDDFNEDSMKQLGAENAHSIICHNTDEENYIVCELAYELYGTKDLIVRLNKPGNYNRFKELGAIVIDPRNAIVNLMDHFVRSPLATSLILGMDESQDTIDVVVNNRAMHGLAIRQLKIPGEVLILSIHRHGKQIISHGYTRVRIGDILTMVGDKQKVEDFALKFEG